MPGALGFVTGSASLVYARFQATAQRRHLATNAGLAVVAESVRAENDALWRDMMDAFPGAFFLRRGGAVTNEHWHVWTRSTMLPTLA